MLNSRHGFSGAQKAMLQKSLKQNGSQFAAAKNGKLFVGLPAGRA